MKKESFEGILHVFKELVRFTAADTEGISFDEEAKVLASVIMDVAENECGFDMPIKDAELKKCVIGLSQVGRELVGQEPVTAIGVASMMDGYTRDTLYMECWPTWSDGKLVNVGETAMSLQGPLEVTGIELDGNGWTLWGFLNGKRYIIDQGNSDIDHPTREDEPCDFYSREG